MQEVASIPERPDMSLSLDTPSSKSLKAEARSLREHRARAGQPMTHSAALEAVARFHGYRDWNTARAALPERIAVPFQIGMRVRGFYLEQPFSGVLIGVQLVSGMRHLKVTVQFDEPVSVTPDLMFATLRQRVTATVDERGISPALRGSGQPQMRIMKE